MLLKRFAALLCVVPLIAIGVSAQGLDTKASPNDWEEINFEYNSSVLVDGFPSLLRLGELLQKNPGYKVKLEGHTDNLGSNGFNDRLGLARANTVRDFLVKYGARPAQIEVTSRGKVDPKYPGQKSTYSRTDEARWMNRRVVLMVADDQGRTVSETGVGAAIRAMEPAQPMQNCCDEVLKRLDKLDDITKALQDLANQNTDLRRQLDSLRQSQQVLESKVNQPPPPPPPAPPTTTEVAQAVTQELNRTKQPKFQLLGVNVGGDSNGHVTATGKGRFFGPFGDHYAFQADAEYLYFHGDHEGQVDFGLVDRVTNRFQAGLFSSFKHVSLADNQNGGTLGQAAVTLDYIFSWGKVGLFGTYGFMDDALINSQAAVLANGIVSPDLFEQRYLRVVNQAGVNFTAGMWGNNYLEGNIGYLKSTMYGDRAGATLRLIFPLNPKIALTVEGDLNPTIVGPSNDERAVVGVQFGNALRPKEYLGVSHALPVEVPRVRYEVVSRQVLVGHSAPIANAGPDQIGVSSGPVTLNGSASYSPDGLPITYQWFEDAGPAVALSSPTSAMTSFAAAAGDSYIFRLVVTDSEGATGTARVHISTAGANRVQIGFFTSNPQQITQGQSATLSWNVTNATTVSISGIGTVAAQGSAPVTPTATTTYTLTATNQGGTLTATATIVVNPVTANVTYCYASPTNIIAGESATLNYQTTNTTSVDITPGVGTQGSSGSVAVSPATSTTYTITATGAGGTTASCSVAVTVTAGQLPRIIQFSANPQTIGSGQSSTLLWNVDNASTVSINTLGNVSLAGTQSVSPAATTTYTLTATNPAGNVTAQATVNVNSGAIVKITSFTATPNPSASPGSAVVLTCQASNATSITLAGTVFTGATATKTVNPTQNTPYPCIATGQNGQTDQQTLAVAVNGSSSGGGPAPVITIQGGNTINTIYRTVTLDASASSSPSGNTPLTYEWVSINNAALVFNADSPVTRVTLGTTPGPYLFNVTVVDSKGNSSTTIVTVILTVN